MGRQSLPLKGQAPTARRATGCGGFRTSVLWRFTPLDCFEAGKNEDGWAPTIPAAMTLAFGAP